MGIQMLVPLGKEKVVLYSEIAGMIVDIILNALLIPKMASTGAAIGTLAAEIAVFIVQYVHIVDEFVCHFANTGAKLNTNDLTFDRKFENTVEFGIGIFGVTDSIGKAIKHVFHL